MTNAAERNVGIIVSFLTIQVVTVLFVVVSAFIWLLPTLPAEDHKAGKISIAALPALITLVLLAIEIRLYAAHTLRAPSYLLLQVAKTSFWAFFLSLLLRAVLAVDAARAPRGLWIFGDAAWKLLLPFLASLATAAVWWRQDYVTRARARRARGANADGDRSATLLGHARPRDAAVTKVEGGEGKEPS